MQINNKDVNLTLTLLNSLFRINNMIHQVKETIIILNVTGDDSDAMYVRWKAESWCQEEAETGIRVYFSMFLME